MSKAKLALVYLKICKYEKAAHFANKIFSQIMHFIEV